MQPNEHFKRVVKILIFAFLCTEMQTTYTHRELLQQRGIGRSQMSAGDKCVSIHPSYQASIRLLTEEQDYFGKGHICSGALVAPSVVLTVAQCLYNSAKRSYYHPAELRVALGNSQRFAPSAQGLVYGVTHIYQSPKQRSLAILMLEQDVPSAETQTRIQPIALPLANAVAAQQPSDTWLVSSWGTAGYEQQQQQLHDLLNLPVNQTQCEQPQQLCVLYAEQVQQSQLALDTGATLTAENSLLGLRSESQSTFVDVASHVDWIQECIGDGTNQNSSIWGMLGLLVFTVYVLKCSRKSFFA
ncbi:CG6067 [Drosophila busckii]|uniref:CG6067 n=1 Tax=Drosophila busckii TaxID=30019 RepID=A0A0M4EQT1_DROBS|nr:trypsin-4 isoform X2 [Drosophila busckii]ALC48340.1 CG6067 [Drosophila busckii]